MRFIIANGMMSKFLDINGFPWDHDGTIFDTQDKHARVESQLLLEYGINISARQITQEYSGVRTTEFFQKLFSEQHIKTNIELLMKKKWKMLIDLVDKEGLNFMPGAEWLIKNASRHGIKQVIGSASNKDFIEYCLNKKNVRGFFEGIVSGEEVKKGKPDPETWDKCSKILNVPYSKCLVLEDGKSGLIAARALGMKTIALLPKSYFYGNEEYRSYIADYYTHDFSKVAFFRSNFNLLVN